MSLNIQSIPYPELTTIERDALTNVIKGYRIYNTTVPAFEFYDGASWVSFGSEIDMFKINSNSGNSYASFNPDGTNEYLTIKGTDGSLIAEFLDNSDAQVVNIDNLGTISVKNNTSLFKGLTLLDDVAVELHQFARDGIITLRANGSDRIRLHSNGESYIHTSGWNFGLGTLTPQSHLHIYDSLQLTSTDAEEQSIYVQSRINQSGTAAYNALKIDVTETTLGDGTSGDGNNLLNLAIGGTTKTKITNTGQLHLDVDQQYGINTGISFGNNNIRFYEQSAYVLNFQTATGIRFQFSTNYIRAGSAGTGAAILNGVVFPDPTLVPYYNDIKTGIGRAAQSQLSHIANNLEGLRIDGATTDGFVRTWINPDGAVGAGTGITFGSTKSAIYEPSDDTLNIRSSITNIGDTSLGSELNTISNAVSDPNGNEIDATTGWSTYGLDQGSNVFESQSGIVNAGSYAFKCDNNPQQVNGARIQISMNVAPFNLVHGKTYMFSFDIRHIGTGGDWSIQLTDGAGNSTWVVEDIPNTATTWVSYEIPVVFNSAEHWFRIFEDSGTNDGGVYFDNFSVKEIPPAGIIVNSSESLFNNPLHILDEFTIITRDGSNNLSFTDAVSGTKTLADLLDSSNYAKLDTANTFTATQTINDGLPGSTFLQFEAGGNLDIHIENVTAAYSRGLRVVNTTTNYGGLFAYGTNSTNLSYLTLGKDYNDFGLRVYPDAATELAYDNGIKLATTATGIQISDNAFFVDTNTYITRDGSNNLSFTDAISGTKTLAEILATLPYRIQSNSGNTFVSFETSGADEFLTIKASTSDNSDLIEIQNSGSTIGAKFTDEGRLIYGVAGHPAYDVRAECKIHLNEGKKILLTDGLNSLSEIFADGKYIRFTALDSSGGIYYDGRIHIFSNQSGSVEISRYTYANQDSTFTLSYWHQYSNTTGIKVNYISGGSVDIGGTRADSVYLKGTRGSGNTLGGHLYLDAGNQHPTTSNNGAFISGSVFINSGATSQPLHIPGDIVIGNLYGNVAFGHVSPTDKIDVEGTSKLQGIRDEIKTITDDYITTKNDYCIEVDATSNPIEIELLEPITENNGQKFEVDIYNDTNSISVISYSNTSFDVDSITAIGTPGTTYRYSLNGLPDLSSVSIGDKIKIVNSINTENDGYFLITDVSDGSDYIEITNASGILEVSDSTSEIKVIVFTENTFSTGNFKTFRAYSNRNTYKRIN